MLGGLPRIEAPKDFDFQLKARIARGRPADGPTSPLFPALRYVLPLSAVLILISIIALSGLYFVGERKVPEPESVESKNPVPAPTETLAPKDETPSPNEVAEGKPAPENPEVEPLVPKKEAPEKPFNDETARKRKNDGGSRDVISAPPKIISVPDDGRGSNVFSSSDGRTIGPKGTDSNRPIPEQEVKTTTGVAEMLDFSGIKAAPENDRMTVRSVRKNSIAERSGVRVGDVIEAINGDPVTGEPLSGRSVTVKTLTILRKGQRKEITFQSQQ